MVNLVVWRLKQVVDRRDRPGGIVGVTRRRIAPDVALPGNLPSAYRREERAFIRERDG